MARTGDKLTPKQETAIAALLTEPSVAAAATKAGIAVRTLHRWLDEDPAFDDAYRAARRQAVQQAISRLQQMSTHATTVLGMLMADRMVSPGVRVRAAIAVLEFALQAVQLEDLESRLAAVEAQIGGQRR